METIEDTGREVGTDKETKKPNRGPTVLIVVLAVALVGLVAWMVFMMRPNSPNAAPAEIVQLMEDYTAAWNAYDADVMEGLVTSSYRIHSDLIDRDIEGLRTYQMPSNELSDWQATDPGPYYAVAGGGNVWYVSTEGGEITRSGTDYGHSSVLKVVERNGEFLVDEHFFMGG